MIYKKSCGFVAYKEIENERLYLIVRTSNGEYGFPKGHVENNETEHETAIRELKEETNIEVQMINGFRRQIEYEFPNRADVMKISVYFLGKYLKDEIICQESEVLEARFVPMKTALELLSFEETRNILREADTYIESMNSAE